ncbi:hypothetical protein F5144DRAFT_543430 [Chaetomium tenue]|uniref:Uncharacterized protein n=1 Tax=Chaetomium tenue TaxID=1854479 RepID=A0ACB7PNC4_9PEZI|nr:hypothetical protein F5144DRAFT_543430 [Chaetomium globosum]
MHDPPTASCPWDIVLNGPRLERPTAPEPRQSQPGYSTRYHMRPPSASGTLKLGIRKIDSWVLPTKPQPWLTMEFPGCPSEATWGTTMDSYNTAGAWRTRNRNFWGKTTSSWPRIAPIGILRMLAGQHPLGGHRRRMQWLSSVSAETVITRHQHLISSQGTAGYNLTPHLGNEGDHLLIGPCPTTRSFCRVKEPYALPNLACGNDVGNLEGGCFCPQGLWQRASCGRRRELNPRKRCRSRLCNTTPFGLAWPYVVKTQFTRK